MKYLLVAILLTPCLASAETGRALMNKMIRTIELHNELTYDVEYMFKIAQDPETLYFKGHAIISRNEKQNYWKAKFRLADFDKASSYMLCTGNKLYIASKVHKTVNIHDQLSKDRVGLGSYNEQLLMHEFLHPEYMEYYENADKISRLRDTMINGIPCYQIAVVVKYDAPSDETKMIFCISKKDHFPLFQREYVYFDFGTQYREWLYKTHSFTADKTKLSKKQIPEYYRVKRWKVVTEVLE
jgi:hypothetical protein